MRLIKKPKKPQHGPLFERACTGCGNDGGGCHARVELSSGDLFTTWEQDDLGVIQAVTTWTCPWCGSHNDL